MFLGVIVLCSSMDVTVNVNDCISFGSPSTYATEEACLAEMASVLMGESMILYAQMGWELRNAKCFNLDPMAGKQGA